MPRPLLLTADPDLLDELLRLASSAAVEVEAFQDAGAARRSWPTAPLVLLGADVAGAGGQGPPAGLVRRPGVVLVAQHEGDPAVWQRAVEVGAEHVALLPDGEAWVVARLAEAAEGSGPAAPLVAVLGGRGGAGATTLASALALSARPRGLAPVLVDADALGGGVDMVFGGELSPGIRWSDLAGSRGRLPGRALLDALPVLHGVPVLAFDRDRARAPQSDVAQAALAAVRRAADLVVVDTPRSFDEPATAVLSTAAVALLVVPAEVRATAAAARVAARAAELCADLRLVVRGPSPGGLAPADVVRALGLPLAGSVRPEPGLEGCLERGEPPSLRARSPLAALCQRLLDDLVRPAEHHAA